MRLLSIYIIVIFGLFIVSCGPIQFSENQKKDFTFVQEVSDLTVDPSIEYGELANGLRYAVRSNSTPTKTATLLMRIDTGSINESAETRGLAHFLEHMAFNGSKNIPEGEMIKRLETFGLSFGADTNASTGFFETTYQLELPEVDEDILNETLMIMRETAGNLTLDPEAIDRERGVILAEKRARSSPAFDAFMDNLEFFLGDSLVPERLPIGTEETIATLSAEQFRDFYEGYYRPENTFIVLVGDIETDHAAKKIEEYFADWQGIGESRSKYQVKPLPKKTARTRYYANPEIQTTLSLSGIQKFEKLADTQENRKQIFINRLGNYILSQRLGELSRTTDAPFIGASAGTHDVFEAATISTLTIQPEKGKWDTALKGAEPVLRQALQYGFSQSELDEQIANVRKNIEVSVQTASTRRTPSIARTILTAFGDEAVVTTPEDNLARFNAYADDISIAEVNEAFRAQWKTIETAPQIYLATSEIIEGAEAKLETALREAREIAVTPRKVEDSLEFAYSEWGQAGKVKSRETVKDIGFEKIVFENGVKLNVKQTPYQKDSISISVALDGGELFLPREEPGLRIFAPNALSLGGLEAHSVDDLRKIMAGRSVGVGQSFGTDRRYLNGSTVPEDLDLQLDLMAAYMTAQGYRPEAKAQYDKYIKSFYPTLDSTPNGVASRDVPRLIRSGDTRFGYPSEEEMLRVTTEMVKAYMSPFVKKTAIEIGIVGDITPDDAVKAVARTFGALPKQQSEFTEPPLQDLKLTFPNGSKRAVKLSHAGDASTALFRVYWPTPDGRKAQTSREISMLATLFRLRLTEVLREEEGASYSPSAFTFTPRTYPDYGYFAVSLEVSPDDIDRISQKVDDIAAEFRAGSLDEDLFTRGMKPVLENIETSLESNAYWMDVIASGQTDEERLNRHRSRAAAYQNMTVEDLKRRAKTLFSPESAYRIQILPEG